MRAPTRLDSYLDRPGLAQVVRLERDVSVGGESSVEVQSLITGVRGPRRF